MTDNIKHAIDEKIKKLTMLRSIADDPEMLSLLKDLVNPSGNTGSGDSSQQEPLRLTAVSGDRKRARRGEQQRATELALSQATEPVNTDWLVERMKRNGFVFLATKPRVAVNECLREAQRHGRAEIARTDGVENYWVAKK